MPCILNTLWCNLSLQIVQLKGKKSSSSILLAKRLLKLKKLINLNKLDMHIFRKKKRDEVNISWYVEEFNAVGYPGMG